MSQIEKLITRFLTFPKDFTYDEMVRLLVGLGFKENSKGKTSGSRVGFHSADIRIASRFPQRRQKFIHQHSQTASG